MELSHSFDTLTSPRPRSHQHQSSDHGLEALPPPPSTILSGEDHHIRHHIIIKQTFISEDKPPLAPSCCSRQSRPLSHTQPCHDSCGQSTCRRGSRGHVSHVSSACHTASRDSGTMRRKRTLSRHNSLERARCNIVHSR